MTDREIDYETEYKKISSEVSAVTKDKKDVKDVKDIKSYFKLNTKTPLLYIIIVIFVLILLILSKPPFIREIKIENEKEITKISYTKLLISTVIISFIISLSTFVYFYKKH
jgi:C4-dicarboxylate transporter